MRPELVFEAQPFQGYTEFDEFEWNDPELFESEAFGGADEFEAFDFEYANLEADETWMGEIDRGRSDYVKWVQVTLGFITGSQLPISGVLDEATKNAIASFQKRARRPASGSMDAETEARLIDAAIQKLPGKRKNQTYNRWVQLSLSKVAGTTLALTGSLDKQTRDAVIKFQTSRKLGADGKPGSKTASALIEAGADLPDFRAWAFFDRNFQAAVDRAGSFFKQLRTGQIQPEFTGLPGIENTTQQFRERAIRIANNLGIQPKHLLAVMSFETGRSFSPAQPGPGGATGLLQFIPSTAARLGTTTAALARMTAEEQLDYVEKYLSPYKGQMHSLEDLYIAVFGTGRGMGQGLNYVLYEDPGRGYRANQNMDINRDGKITVGEATQFLKNSLGAYGQRL